GGDDPQEGRLSRPVRPEQPGHPRSGFEVDAVQRGGTAEGPGEAMDAYGDHAVLPSLIVTVWRVRASQTPPPIARASQPTWATRPKARSRRPATVVGTVSSTHAVATTPTATTGVRRPVSASA